MDEEIVYSPNKYRETEGIKDDGDIVLSTDNKYFIKGSHKDHNIITYEKGLATPAKMTTANITKTVMKGFGTGVGGFSNTATILYAMAAIFDKPGHEDQRDEIMTRIKLLREIVGQEIDRIKGADKPSLPQDWKKPVKITESDSPDEILRKIRQNAMVVSKKPYFFRYLYPELNQRFKEFEASYNQVSRDMFGIKFKKLLKKENKTDEEKMLIRRYQKYSPLITAPCTMNKLCREFENIDFDIKFQKTPTGEKKPPVSMLPTFEDKFAPTFDPKKLAAVKKIYQSFSSHMQLIYLSDLIDPSAGVDRTGTIISTEDQEICHQAVYNAFIASLQKELYDTGIAGDEFLFYCHRLAPKYASFNWSFAWKVLDEQILNFIPAGDTFCPVRVPQEVYDSTPAPQAAEAYHLYLGEYYRLAKLTPPQATDLAAATTAEELSSSEIYELLKSAATELSEDSALSSQFTSALLEAALEPPTKFTIAIEEEEIKEIEEGVIEEDNE